MRPSTLSPADKVAIGVTCQEFIDTVLRPRFLPTITPTSFNYPIDIQGKWHGAKYRFIQRYRSGFSDNSGEEFDAPFVRIDWIRPDRFDVQWHRHTGQWVRVSQGLPLKAALDAIISSESRHPL